MTSELSRPMSRKNLDELRRNLVRAVVSGVHPEDAAVSLGVARSTVFGWLKMAWGGGLQALAVKKAPGPESKLTDAQLDQLVRWLVGKNPRQLRFDSALRTWKMVGELIQREFGVSYTPQGIGKLLARLGFSPQRPLVRAYQQDPERVARWKAEEYPRIRALAAREGATILFADEASVRTDYHAGTTWAPIGVTLVVRGTGARLSVNMISAVTLREQLYFSFVDGAGNAVNFISFLKSLLQDIEGKIFVIVDGHSAHTAKATKKFLAEQEGRLSLFFLPRILPSSIPTNGCGRTSSMTGLVASRHAPERRCEKESTRPSGDCKKAPPSSWASSATPIWHTSTHAELMITPSSNLVSHW